MKKTIAAMAAAAALATGALVLTPPKQSCEVREGGRVVVLRAMSAEECFAAVLARARARALASLPAQDPIPR